LLKPFRDLFLKPGYLREANISLNFLHLKILTERDVFKKKKEEEKL